MYKYTDFIPAGDKKLLYTYSTKHFAQKDKVRFYYALKGRSGKEGIVKELRLQQLGKAVFLCPYRCEEDIDAFFQLWNIPFTKRKAIVELEEKSYGHCP
jgi:hypothetical protein